MGRSINMLRRQVSGQTALPKSSYRRALNESPCERCGGLMVIDSCLDLLADAGEIDCTVVRCVRCGNLVDPVILSNRARVEMEHEANWDKTPEPQTFNKTHEGKPRVAFSGMSFA